MPEPHTIDTMIEALKKMREESPLKGDTCVYVCLPEVDYIPLDEMKLDKDPSGGAVVLIIP